MKRITIIGINDQIPHLPDEVKATISGIRFFAGGKRHHELVKDYLQHDHHWRSIVVPLEKLFVEMRSTDEPWVIFASGDPLFFGIGNTLKREFPGAEIHVISQFNSFQLLGHRFGINYGEYPVISLTGRAWKAFDKALIEGAGRLAILTDRKKTPATIAARMLEFGYENYRMLYGEKMGGEEERVCKVNLKEALTMTFSHPNCFFLEKTNDAIPVKGISETAFEPLEGRPRMITKMPVRLTTLALMQLNRRKVFWDIGACTGSISIEARINYPHLDVTAFEIRPESEGVIQRNAQKFQTPGITLITGDYLKANKEQFDAPDAVFLGGYGGLMEAFLNDINICLQPGGVIGFNSVSCDSRQRFIQWCTTNNYTMEQQHAIQINDHNPIQVMVARKPV
jgi:precorrin-6Y C5,15-methyltransferase (decarboxylating)